MRVMFAVFPSTAHFLPIVPYAWALQSSGHSVCVATPPGIATGVAVPDFHKAIMATGLNAVPCGVPQPLSVHDRDYPDYASLLPTMEESERYAAALAMTPAERADWDVFYHFQLLTARNYHPPGPRQDIEALIEFAADWRPDLVLWDSWFPCGAVAARVCGAAHARVLNAPDYAGWAFEAFNERRDRLPADLAEFPMAATIRPLAERHGVEVDEELLVGQATIDPFPAAMRQTSGIKVIPSRYVTYTGASDMPSWLHKRPERPRVAISLGVSTRMFLSGDWGRTAKLMEAVRDLDVEVIATLNASQLADVTAGIPGNVRTLDYVPLGQLLPTCDAIIHHGGPGTFCAAIGRGVPQLVCDTDEPTRLVGTPSDGPITWNVGFQKQITASRAASYVLDAGAGVRLNHQTQSAQEMRSDLARVIDDPSFRAGAAAAYEEWQATPSPADLVPALEKLADQGSPP
jgi:UDP:flavonoid glycosyltransferase YjiC (YdhE family)